MEFARSSANEIIPLGWIGFVGTIFWITATIGPVLVDPTKPLGNLTNIVSPDQVRAYSAFIAFLIHTLVPAGLLAMAFPFHAKSEWYPTEFANEVHVGKYKGHIRLDPDDDICNIMVPVTLLEGISGYTLEFDASNPYELEITDKPLDEQSVGSDSRTLSCDDPEHNVFVVPVEVSLPDGRDVGMGNNYQMTVEDTNRGKKILSVDIVK